MPFNPQLKIGEVISNDELRKIFKCGNMGGMRKSKNTNTLVIVSDHTKGLYDDRWEGDILHYTGMGKIGNQDINFAQNRTLNESSTNGIDVFLFEVIKKKEYIYMGQVMLYDHPYQEDQPDEYGQNRKVWIFPVKLKEPQEVALISENLVKRKYLEKAKKAGRLSTDEVKHKAQQTGKKKVGSRSIVIKSFERNSYVVEFAKRRANGICELCKESAPFKNREGEPYLETHHIKWLSNGGEDTIENTVALCPNCHRKMHIIGKKEDIKKLERIQKY